MLREPLGKIVLEARRRRSSERPRHRLEPRHHKGVNDFRPRGFELGVIPAVDTKPTVGRKPTNALCAAGARTEPPVSVPKPTTPKLAATLAPVPPDEPPVAKAV